MIRILTLVLIPPWLIAQSATKANVNFNYLINNSAVTSNVNAKANLFGVKK
jgi:hypothetical protein